MRTDDKRSSVLTLGLTILIIAGITTAFATTTESKSANAAPTTVESVTAKVISDEELQAIHLKCLYANQFLMMYYLSIGKWGQ